MLILSRALYFLGRVILIIYASFIMVSCANKHTIDSSIKPCLSPHHSNTFRLVTPYVVRIDNVLYRVPSNFTTDLASIPRPLWGFFSPHDSRVIFPAVLHDYFYSDEVNVTRKFADDVFYNHMIAEGATKKRAWFYWAVVRLFGKWSFKEYDARFNGLD